MQRGYLVQQPLKRLLIYEYGGFGFNNRRPMRNQWQYQGRMQHPQWQGTYECSWENMKESAEDNGFATRAVPPELIWIVRGDARLFGQAAALKSQGFQVTVGQD